MMTSKPSSTPPSDRVNRRGLVARLAAAGAAGFAAFRVSEASASDELPRVVYHLSDKEKVQFVLGNIENHYKGMGGPDKVKIALVANGPALTAFASKDINPDVARRLRKLAGVDYKQAAIDYVSKLDPERRHHLYTKPFYNLAHKPDKYAGEGLDVDAYRHFCDFANMAVSLALPAGAVGEPPPETLKVSMTSAGGWQNSVTFILTGLDIEQKAEAALAALWARTPGGREAFATAAVDLVGGGGGREGTTDGPPLALLKVTVQDPDEATVGRAFSDAAVQIGLASYPGLYYSAPPANAKPSQRYWPGTVSAAAVTQRVLFEGAELPVKVPPERRSPVPPVLVGEVWSPPPGDQVPVAFGRVFGARSGDKGGDLNIGVWARSDAAAAWLLAEFDAKALVEAVPTYAGLVIDRYPLPNLRGVNFVLRDGLGEGVAAGTLVDAQGKAAGEILRAARVHLPVDLALSAGGVGRSRSTGYD